MFQAPGIGFGEWILIALVALIVFQPKELPLMFRKVGQFFGRLRGMAAEFRSSFDEIARQSELDELRKEVEALRRHTNLNDITEDWSPRPYPAGIDDLLTPEGPPSAEEDQPNLPFGPENPAPPAAAEPSLPFGPDDPPPPAGAAAPEPAATPPASRIAAQ